MRYTLMHISDVHAGPPFNRYIADVVARQAHELRPDLLVISGDLVQRASFTAQWRTALAYLETLPKPQLIVPGNHDVPLYNLIDRIFFPLRRYRHFISKNLNPVFIRPGLAVVGGCTAHGLTVDGGYLNRRQLVELERAFAHFGPDVCKVAVLHHHVIDPPGIHGRRRILNSHEAIHLLDRCGVDLLLCGHVHVSYVGNTLDVLPDLRQGTVICQSGTTTSRRGKGREQGKNSFNIIEIDDYAIRISQYLYLEQVNQFAPVANHTFPRRSSGVYELPRSEQILEAN